ncbi:nicotinate phosphoribosyltransferase [Patescibacteria group bacterium]|nr:nicotinate phosphoribosyltransferase [Patescibacteria group bacterium]
MDEPIITSLLDLDFYKLTMQQLALIGHPDIRVKFGFVCRAKDVNLPGVIPVRVLREQLAHLRDLHFLPQDIKYLRSSKYIPPGLFCEEYLAHLRWLRLPEISVEVVGDQFQIEAEGLWSEVTLVETLALSIVNELYNYYQLRARDLPPGAPAKAGRERLNEKIQALQASSLRDSLQPQCIVEFGTRRRFAGWWQAYVADQLARRSPELFAGTSNVRLAQRFDLRPIGTFAHELDMVYSRLYGNRNLDIRVSHSYMLQDWWALYREPLSIALTDTYGTNAFFKDFNSVQAQDWRGVRHDSGSWLSFGEKVIAFYEQQGIDPQTKTVVWSDGLTPDVVLAINQTFGQRIRCVYGWGTNLTNDFGAGARENFGVRPLSIVMKVIESNGQPTVKLSDNPAKAIGPQAEIERFQRIFGYNPADYERVTCVY